MGIAEALEASLTEGFTTSIAEEEEEEEVVCIVFSAAGLLLMEDFSKPIAEVVGITVPTGIAVVAFFSLVVASTFGVIDFRKKGLLLEDFIDSDVDFEVFIDEEDETTPSSFVAALLIDMPIIDGWLILSLFLIVFVKT